MTSQASNQIVTIIGRNIAAARDEVRNGKGGTGMTQREVALKLGLDTRAVNRWERGGIVPSATNLVQLAQIFGRDPGWFYTRHEGVDYDDRVAA